MIRINTKDGTSGLLEIIRSIAGQPRSIDVVHSTLETLEDSYPGTVWAVLRRAEASHFEAHARYSVAEKTLRSICREACSDSVNVESFVGPGGGDFGSSRWVAAPQAAREPDLILAVWVLPGGAFPSYGELQLLAQVVANSCISADECERLRTETTSDELTGVLNRRGLVSVLEQECARAHRYDRPLSLLFIDVDRFKAINDLHGHRVGDKALVEIAAVLKASVRQCDTLGRVGGDEFVLVLPDTTLDAAEVLANRIQRDLADRSVLMAGKLIQLSVSIGASCIQEQGSSSLDAATLLDLADQRMLKRKRANTRSSRQASWAKRPRTSRGLKKAS